MQVRTRKKEKRKKHFLTIFFPVVGIGASAGGIDAFKRLIKAIPENSGMAYILVQHLDPSHKSILTHLLQKITPIPVHEITNNVEVLADHIYIIPSNKLLTATDGVLELTGRLPKNQRNMPIDLLFTSLAEVHRNHAIGVVLSGTQADGTLGLKAIKKHGGITFAQEPDSAAYDGMPRSAIQEGVVDFILEPEKIPVQLATLLHDKLKIVPAKPDGQTKQAEEITFKQILSLLFTRKGIDFTYNTQSTIRRRLIRRMDLMKKSSLEEYLAYLKENIAEQDNLYYDLLIPLTQFFRDPKIFDAIAEHVFPALFKDRSVNDHVRIWVAGCSTGEEAYSIVMHLHEYLGDKLSAYKIQLFATDVSDIAITTARKGIYNKNQVNGLSPARLERFFTKTDDMFVLNKSVREICVFAIHNFLTDPPFAKIDLVSCRNSLIYLQSTLQKYALTNFHYALNEKGFLSLGKSETIGQSTDLYTIFDKNSRIYKRQAVNGKILQAMGYGNEAFLKAGGGGFIKKKPGKENYQKIADDILLTRYAPPGVIINNNMDIVQFRGATGMWLEPLPGKPDFNLLKMARDGLSFELLNVLKTVKTQNIPVVKENIAFTLMGKERFVTIEVIPLLNTDDLYHLILFTERAILPEGIPEQTKGKKHAALSESRQNKYQIQIKALKMKHVQNRQELLAMKEEQEVSYAELQSANEELLSGSEELQSLNEELETSQEEIQTSNEEFNTVNQELTERVEQLHHLNEQLNHSKIYAESIVNTIGEPLVILNKELQVRSANMAFHHTFHTSEETTEGKFFFDLENLQGDTPDLRTKLEKMLSEKTNVTDFEIRYHLPSSGELMMCLNATRILKDKNGEPSILLAFEDITEKRKTEIELKLFAEELEKQVLRRTLSLHAVNSNLRHSNENLKRFAYIASHDLQEPLRKVITYSSFLHDDYKADLPDGAKKLIGKITSASERMSVLITELLNFSTVVHGEAVFKKVNLDHSLLKVINDFELLINEKKAVIHHELLPEIEGIGLQIHQLFYNVISNSLKFSRKGIAPVITISVKMLTRKEMEESNIDNPNIPHCEISIQDNGIGFEQQYSDKIFLIFHRLHSHERFPGTGIGLALCKTIVMNHHGEISVISRQNEGTKFVIILPLKQ